MTYSGAAPTAGGTTSNSASNSFNVGDSGTITVNDRMPATNATPVTITGGAVAVIVGHGKNGLGAYTAKETQNAPPASGTDEAANVPVATWVLPTAFY